MAVLSTSLSYANPCLFRFHASGKPRQNPDAGIRDHAAPANDPINITCEGDGVSRGCRDSCGAGAAVSDRMERGRMATGFR